MATMTYPSPKGPVTGEPTCDADATCTSVRNGVKRVYRIEYRAVPSRTVTMPLQARPKVGRNVPCPCGSGRKYKRCCLRRAG